MIKLIIYFYLATPSTEDIYEECQRQGVLFPYIVTQQAILETGHLKSYNFRIRQNLFGLRHKRFISDKNKNGYFTFFSWRESVTAYRDYLQYRYRGGDYYKWLSKIGYAEAGGYIKLLKQIKVFR